MRLFRRKRRQEALLDNWPDPIKYFSIEETLIYPFFEDEEATGLYGYGHQDSTFFAGMANKYYHDAGQHLISDAFTESDVMHTYGVFYRDRKQPEDVLLKVGDAWVDTKNPLAYKDLVYSRSFPLTMIKL